MSEKEKEFKELMLKFDFAKRRLETELQILLTIVFILLLLHLRKSEKLCLQRKI